MIKRENKLPTFKNKNKTAFIVTARKENVGLFSSDSKPSKMNYIITLLAAVAELHDTSIRK